VLVVVGGFVASADGRRRTAGLPWVLDGEVRALVAADGKVFVAGDFRNVATPNGRVPVAAAVALPTARADMAAQAGKIVAAGDDGLYVVNSDGSGLRRITLHQYDTARLAGRPTARRSCSRGAARPRWS
jgi:hypothetical protein